MGDLKHSISSRILEPTATPLNSIAIKVQRDALRSVVGNGLRKTSLVERLLPFGLRRWINVEASEEGTTDSVFFVPETPNIDHRQSRVEPAQYIKINPSEHDDVVRKGEDFEISFVGMSVAPMDAVGNNELLLCSLTRNDGIMPDDRYAIKTKSMQTAESEDEREEDEAASALAKKSLDPVVSGLPTEENPEKEPTSELKPPKRHREADLADLPSALTVQPGDVPFLHYDPEVDGHDTGSAPNQFVPIPGSKRVYLQRKGIANLDVFVRFTVMEVDKLSEEQLIAIKSLEDIGKSVGKAAATVPYLKFISWILKFANYIGSSALKKVSEPEHVLSKDIAFILAEAEGQSENSSVTTGRREEYGNYLRYGYYYFLSSTVDAKLYAQTGASSQNVPLLIRRHAYNSKFAFKNEREYFELGGVSYVAIKVSRGCSPLDLDQRGQMLDRHRGQMVRLLKKYTGKLTDAVPEQMKK